MRFPNPHLGYQLFLTFLGLGVKNRSNVFFGLSISIFLFFASPATGLSRISRPSLTNSSQTSGSRDPPLASLCPLAKCISSLSESSFSVRLGVFDAYSFNKAMRLVSLVKGLRLASRTEKFTFPGTYPIFATPIASNFADLRWPALHQLGSLGTRPSRCDDGMNLIWTINGK
jgi:hypothetical protein